MPGRTTVEDHEPLICIHCGTHQRDAKALATHLRDPGDLDKLTAVRAGYCAALWDKRNAAGVEASKRRHPANGGPRLAHPCFGDGPAFN